MQLPYYSVPQSGPRGIHLHVYVATCSVRKRPREALAIIWHLRFPKEILKVESLLILEGLNTDNSSDQMLDRVCDSVMLQECN